MVSQVAPATRVSGGRFRMLDAFCGVGGASVGYFRAGFDVSGVDIAEQPRYPFRFALDDAVTYVLRHGAEYDVIAGSPPCQLWSKTLNFAPHRYAHHLKLECIDAFRDACISVGKPFIIENVESAPLRKDLILCGEVFGLEVLRHRVFEIHGFTVPQPEHKFHKDPYYYRQVAGRPGGTKGNVAEWRAAMGIDWTSTARELAQAIPPAYTEYIGRHLLTQLGERQWKA